MLSELLSAGTLRQKFSKCGLHHVKICFDRNFGLRYIANLMSLDYSESILIYNVKSKLYGIFGKSFLVTSLFP